MWIPKMMKFQSLNTLPGSNNGNGKSTMWMEYLPGRMGIFHCYVSLPECHFLCFVELKGDGILVETLWRYDMVFGAGCFRT